MKFQGFNIICDIEATNKYRDKYNDQCPCDECKNFRTNFITYYPEIISFLNQFGIGVDYPLEIMDDGFDDEKSKRRYSVYYSVKGELPKDKLEMTISGTMIVLRNWNVADEAYANTGMKKPFFIIEILNLFLKDTKYEFYCSVKCGREIEFTYNEKKYFESRNSDTDWYIYCEETKKSQHFLSADELLKDIMLENCNINVLWNEIKLDYIL